MGYLLIVFFAVIVFIFAVQNAAAVSLSFIFWKFEASLSMIVVIFFAAGVISTAAAIFVNKIKKNMKLKESRKVSSETGNTTDKKQQS